jgi:hypothetical protein
MPYFELMQFSTLSDFLIWQGLMFDNDGVATARKILSFRFDSRTYFLLRQAFGTRLTGLS